MAIRLRDIGIMIRAANSGATRRTLDVMFDREEDFKRVWNSHVISPSLISRLYGVAAADVGVYDYPPALMIKVTIPRKLLQGGPADNDIDGKQQYVPLMNIVITD